MQFVWKEHDPLCVRDGRSWEQEEGVQAVLAFSGQVQREL